MFGIISLYNIINPCERHVKDDSFNAILIMEILAATGSVNGNFICGLSLNVKDRRG